MLFYSTFRCLKLYKLCNFLYDLTDKFSFFEISSESNDLGTPLIKILNAASQSMVSTRESICNFLMLGIAMQMLGAMSVVMLKPSSTNFTAIVFRFLSVGSSKPKLLASLTLLKGIKCGD